MGCAVPLVVHGDKDGVANSREISPGKANCSIFSVISGEKGTCPKRAQPCLPNYCLGMCFRQLHIMYNRQFHITSKLNQWPESHCQSLQRSSCHVCTQRVVAVLPFNVPGEMETLATDRRSQDTRSHTSELHKESPSAEPDCCNEPTVPDVYYSGTKQP